MFFCVSIAWQCQAANNLPVTFPAPVLQMVHKNHSYPCKRSETSYFWENLRKSNVKSLPLKMNAFEKLPSVQIQQM